MKPSNEKLARIVGTEINKQAISNINKKMLDSLIRQLTDSIHNAKISTSNILQFLKDEGYTIDYYMDLFNKLDGIYDELLEQHSSIENIPNKTQKEWNLSKGFGK